MSTNTYRPISVRFDSDTLPSTFDYARSLDADAVLPFDQAAELVDGCVVPAPYNDPRMADLDRYAVVVPDAAGNTVVLGRVVAVPAGWEAFSADGSYLFGELATLEQAAAYICLSVER